MPKERPFKKFFCDRKETFLIPSAAFKIWMYHYCLEGKERCSWPSRTNICKHLGIGLNALYGGRKWLQENGWLEKLGDKSSEGEFKVPIYRVIRGTALKRGAPQNRVVPAPQNRAMDRAPKQGAEVDTKKQVDTIEVEKEKMPENSRQKGQYKKGEFGYLNGKPEKIYTTFVEIWSDYVGPGAICRKPYKRGWDWFEETCKAAEADTLVPAFELWAKDNADPSTDQPIGDFLRDLTKYTQLLVVKKPEDLDAMAEVERIRAQTIQRSIAEAKARNACIMAQKQAEAEVSTESVEELLARLGAQIED